MVSPPMRSRLPRRSPAGRRAWPSAACAWSAVCGYRD